MMAIPAKTSVAAVDSRIALARAGDESAIRSLIKQHNRTVYRVARGILGNDADSEDVVQDTYVRAFSNLESYRGESSFGTWLTRIAINEALGRKRRARPTTDLTEIDAEGGPDGGRLIMFPTSMVPPNPEHALARRQMRILLEQVIDELAEGFRSVFMLRDVEGLSVEETAAHLDIPAATVKTRLHRARAMIRSAIDRKLGLAFADLFPFDGARCDRVTDRTVANLRALGFVRT